MIRYEWRHELDVDESAQVHALLDAAAAYDAEPEFSAIDPEEIDHDLGLEDPARRLLLIWMLARPTQVGKDDEPETLAGVLRVVVDRSGVGDVQLVIAPELRSLGIVTLFVERAGLEADVEGGWLGSGATRLRAWAQGNHPAAGRLSDRHFIPRTKRVWKLVRPVVDPWDGSLPTDRVRVASTSTDTASVAMLADFVERAAGSAQACPDLLRDVDNERKTVLVATDETGRVVGALALGQQPVVSIEFGKCLVTDYVSWDPESDDPALTRALLATAFEHAAMAGSEGVIVHVDSENARLVNACRLMRFQHDRTDVRFEL